jgi:hypothetical protein
VCNCSARLVLLREVENATSFYTLLERIRNYRSDVVVWVIRVLTACVRINGAVSIGDLHGAGCTCTVHAEIVGERGWSVELVGGE